MKTQVHALKERVLVGGVHSAPRCDRATADWSRCFHSIFWFHMKTLFMRTKYFYQLKVYKVSFFELFQTSNFIYGSLKLLFFHFESTYPDTSTLKSIENKSKRFFNFIENLWCMGKYLTLCYFIIEIYE